MCILNKLKLNCINFKCITQVLVPQQIRIRKASFYITLRRQTKDLDSVDKYIIISFLMKVKRMLNTQYQK